MFSEEEFFNKWRGQFGTNKRGKFVYPKDHEMDIYLLIVVDDIPTTVSLILYGPIQGLSDIEMSNRLSTRFYSIMSQITLFTRFG